MTNIAAKKVGMKSRYTPENRFMIIAIIAPVTPAFMLRSMFKLHLAVAFREICE
jgi:hypothetical protein